MEKSSIHKMCQIEMVIHFLNYIHLFYFGQQKTTTTCVINLDRLDSRGGILRKRKHANAKIIFKKKGKLKQFFY